MSPYLVINATSLFFHNRRFETPPTKKHITNQVEEWVQRIPPPPSKKQKTTATGSSRSGPLNVNPNPIVKTVAPTTAATRPTTKFTSSAVVIDSTTEVIRKKPAPGTKRRAEVLESASDGDDEGTFSNLRYKGLGEDEDDTLEQADAMSSPVKPPVATQMSKVRLAKSPSSLVNISLSQMSLNIYRGITPPVQVKRTKRQGNRQLPSGALDNGRWAVIFVPTFLRYVAATSKDVWTLKLHDTITALQAIWNEIYKGSVQDRRKKIKHLVEKGDAVHDVVCRILMLLSTISTNYSQSTQRVTDWRSTIGSNGLAVVGDFMDSLKEDTTEDRKKAAEDLLDYTCFVYRETREVIEDGELVVRKATISVPAYPLKVIQIKRGGRYRGALVVQTMAQCLIDFEGAIDVPGFVENDDFPYAAVVLSVTSVCFPSSLYATQCIHDTQVHRALWLWAKGYITKESHESAKLSKSSSILKVRSQDGKFTKKTNFSKDQWDEISDMHMRDILIIGPDKLRVIEGEIRAAADILRRRKSVKKCRVEPEENRSDKKARGSGYQHRVASSDLDV